MSIVLEEKLVTPNRSFVRAVAAGSSSLIRSILLSALFVTSVGSTGIFTVHMMGSLEVSETTSITISAIGAAVCFTSLPILVALYRRKQQLALIAASLLVFSMVMFAGVIS